MKNNYNEPKVEKVTICPCGHPFKIHFEQGCYGLDEKGKFCMCQFDEIEAKAAAFEIQLDQVLKVLNSR